MGTRFRSGFSVAVIVVACFALFGIDSVRGANRELRNVQVAVRAKWSGTPVLLEAGELLSKEWKDGFWDFVEVWLHSEQDLSDSNSAKDCVKKIIKHGRSLLTEPLGSVFELSLLMRVASPRLVVYRQLAEESLSSYAASDESSNSNYVTVVSSETNRNLETKRSDSLLMGVNPTSPGGKCCWVDTGRALFFDVADFQLWLRNLTSFSEEAFRHHELFEFDHVYFDSSLGSPVVILYGALGTECFRDFHVTLIEAAKKGRVTYVVRSVLPSGCEAKADLCGAVGTSDSMNLGGYGVELALKNMEYKAMDDSMIRKGVTLEDPRTEDLSQEVRGFIFSKLLERKPDLTSEVMSFRDYLLSSTVSDTLDVWELKDLGHQTVQRIVQASDPLQSMQEINQNFPSVVSSLSRMKLNVSVKDEILSNQKMIPPGKSLLALNGALVNIEDIDLYELVDIVHQELSLADQFSKLKIPGTTVWKLLSTMPPAEDNEFRVDFRSTHVHYINNLEEDDMYKRWGSNLHEILMPAVPGKSQHIRKNLLHAVFVLDPATICGLESIGMIRSLYDKKFPLRFGLILYSSKLIKELEMSGGEIHSSAVENDSQIEDMSTLIIRLFIYIKENRGTRKAFRFLSNVNKLRTESKSSKDDTFKIDHIERGFVETLLPKAKSPPQDTLLELKKKKQTHREQSQDSSMLVLKLGLANLQCCLLMNGLVFDSNQEALMNAMGEEFRRIQEQVYYRQIDPHTDVLDKILSKNGIARYNPKITGNGKLKPRFVSLSNSFLGGDSVLNDISYLHSPKTIDDVKPVTHILVVDITSKGGMKLLHEGIRYLIGGCKGSRLGVLFGANQDTDELSSLFVKVFNITAYSYSHKKNVLYFMDKLCLFYEQNYLRAPTLTTEDARRFMDKVSELAYANGLPSKAYKTAFSEFSFEKTRKHVKKASQFLYGLLGPECGLNTVITNGRVYPIDETNFMSHDLGLLELVEFKRRVKQTAEIIEDVKWENVDPDMLTSKFISDVIMYVSSMIAARERSSERARFDLLNAQYSAIVRDDKKSGVHIDAVVDPLSYSGQKFASILRLLGKCIQPSLRIVLNPLSSLVDLPLKSYYRYVVPTMDDFSSTDYSVNGPKAFFANMPLSKTLTMNLDVPEPWLVEPVIAVHDLDNILLENLGDTRTLQAVFELEALILTGQCSEDDPPQGLQLILGTKTTPHMVDTIVMVNLGYWQMKVSPGVWYLQLAPGRSSELYILKEEGDGSQQNSKPKRITINDLRGKVVRLEAVKKKGKERETLLVTDDDNKSQKTKGNGDGWNSNLLKWASDLIAGNDPSEKNESASPDHKKVRRHGKTINIFSIASGHLYERFLKIMILSVLKNTQRPVKFWFIKNYLSPPFKDVIPHMAKEYGFEYELITYKWPSWLHKQKEKQRLIWAYKILFLDVIFPLSLEKVIYVDADQIVRTDMGELYDMDIKGRPLAYTPFCDNNKDMDGYRFWQQGFWKEHLRGRPYHISALYVVDLKKFRVTAAGDNLRVVYETLSKDPNSLANLDQDLPNYAQHAVPIFSLPQEWLWCESWCGNATKSKAKTIDLCNNPMTKEPKLQGARRIVPEWPDLDLEARRFTARIMGEEVDQEPSPPANESMEAPIHSFTEEILSNKSEL